MFKMYQQMPSENQKRFSEKVKHNSCGENVRICAEINRNYKSDNKKTGENYKVISAMQPILKDE